MSRIVEKLRNVRVDKMPEVNSGIPHGDMPGDKVEINEGHVKKARIIMERLIEMLPSYFESGEKAVLTVCGGSGVGKSEIASILAFWFNSIGIGTYTMSGDNYPHRIPKLNDAERLRVYEEGGEDALRAYLGSQAEIDFEEVGRIVAAFKRGESPIALKRMGRSEEELWYDDVDMSGTNILIIEWTHGNSDNYEGVDIPIFLDSTPEETLAHRRARARDGAVDSPFTTMVLMMEQDMLAAQSHKAKIIVSKKGELVQNSFGPMLNCYPDSMGGTLSDIVSILERPEIKGAFSSFYILPSLFDSDLDRGFCVKSYELNEEIAGRAALDQVKKLGIDLKLDFVLNHASAHSPQFEDLLANGGKSEYRDFFINWNEFWDGCGEMTEAGFIQPDEKYLKDMFFRKPGLPLLMVEFADGTKAPYWNTFYQEEVTEPDGSKSYLGQMDLNIKSEKVWEFYDSVLSKLASYGAKIIRLDAFAYAPKAPGKKNFLNDPETWELLERVRGLADRHGLKLLPEIHASYEEGIYKTIADKGYMTYDFFLPGLLIDAIETEDPTYLVRWASEIIDNGIKAVNMLGCHDGIPILDLRGLLPEERISNVIDTVVSRGGLIKDLHGAKNIYYQVNSTFYSALGEDDAKLLIARAIQLFMPGKPQIWYLDLFAGANDYEAVKSACAAGHKEINRTNLSLSDVEQALSKDVVKRQLELLHFRNNCEAFRDNAQITVSGTGSVVNITWSCVSASATLHADLKSKSFHIE